MAYYLMTGLLKYLRRHILLYAIYHKMPQGKRLIVDWIEGRTHGQIGDKESILKWLQNQNPRYAVYQRHTTNHGTNTE